ncbi:hypothetical protein NMY22_g9925 [Coprinellus aureogranulatus]|nr:hypothetical protein NMY22_g9925 [Coprinellus aureogranulatus]
MPRKSQKKNLFSADGAHLPDDDDFSAHVDSVLEGLRSVQSKLPGVGIMVSPYMDDLTQLLEDLAKDMDDYAKAGRRYRPKGLWRRARVKARKFFAMRIQGRRPIYVLPDPDNDVLIPRLLHHDHKFERGFNHNAFGRALVPIQYRDPSAFRAKIKNGKVAVTEEDLPSSLFHNGIDYDTDNPTNGFGTGLIFLGYLNHELVGPTSSHGGPPKGSKPSKAVSWKVEKITPRIVASVAVSGMEDGNVDLVALHEKILSNSWRSTTTRPKISLKRSVKHLKTAPKGRRRPPVPKARKPQRPKLVATIKEKREAQRCAASAGPEAPADDDPAQDEQDSDNDSGAIDFDSDDNNIPAKKSNNSKKSSQTADSDSSSDDESSEDKDKSGESSAEDESPQKLRQLVSKKAYSEPPASDLLHGLYLDFLLSKAGLCPTLCSRCAVPLYAWLAFCLLSVT